jgi:NAD(P)-dependent dehydrogenase (short-subunit alcohol dehydrogenase family)
MGATNLPKELTGGIIILLVAGKML